MVGNSSDSKLLARSNSQQSLRPPVSVIQPAGGAGATALAPSPDGSRVAVARKDGVLAIYELATGGLVAGFKVWRGREGREGWEGLFFGVVLSAGDRNAPPLPSLMHRVPTRS